MNRNVESRFSKLPSANIQRSVFDRSHSHKTTFNVGDLVPILCDEVLPGDTVQIDTSKIVRLQTMLAPIYDNIYLDTYYFFVPSRILWSKWKSFMGENDASPWAQTSVPNLPLFTAPEGVPSGSVADHLGLPVGVPLTRENGSAVSALPFVAYDMIYNEFFRDENLIDPVLIDFDNPSMSFAGNVFGARGWPYRVAKYHDYFTSCLPSPQKNTTPVEIPVTGSASGTPATFKIRTGPVDTVTDYSYPMAFTVPVNSANPTPQDRAFNADFSTGKVSFSDSGNFTPQGNSVYPNNLYVDIGSNVGELTGLGIDVNSMRLAIATQVYYEQLARSGSRYEELLNGFYGVQNPDSRLQHPEYLGGNRIHINVHEITNTAQSETEFLGDVGAQSVTTDVHSEFTKSFTEFGYLFCVVCARYDHSYCQGIPKFFQRFSRFDYYNPVFKSIGEQPVYNRELFVSSGADASQNEKVFGYQEAWADYRYAQNRASGLLRPNVSNALGHWSLTDNYAELPVLSKGWIQEDLSNVDRCLAVTSSLSKQFFADFYFNAKWTRPLPMYSIPATFGLF